MLVHHLTLLIVGKVEGVADSVSDSALCCLADWNTQHAAHADTDTHQRAFRSVTVTVNTGFDVCSAAWLCLERAETTFVATLLAQIVSNTRRCLAPAKTHLLRTSK